MRTYGYIIRVATKEQDEDRQRIGMWSFGVAEDNVVLIDPLNDLTCHLPAKLLDGFLFNSADIGSGDV